MYFLYCKSLSELILVNYLRIYTNASMPRNYFSKISNNYNSCNVNKLSHHFFKQFDGFTFRSIILCGNI